MQKIDPKKLAIHERVERLNSMILRGQILEAFEKFYAENVVRHETNSQDVKGKNACRLAEEHFVTGLMDLRKAIVKNVIIHNKVSVVEWDFEYTHQEWGDMKYTQVTVQQWDCNGQICSEIILKTIKN